MHDSLETLWQAACHVRENAYAPYSGYRVGAALGLRNPDGLVVGCNVENASFGATLCAERSAVLRAVAEHGPRPKFTSLVLVTDTPASPCGMCLQVLAEFADGALPVILANPNGIQQHLSLGHFLPHPFQSTSLHTSS